ncbi:MAG: hypothetical protein F6K18_19710 [Okeania sp. SIO2C2]|nr:hypothetical protein [Okeania sp. SIO2C2]
MADNTIVFTVSVDGSGTVTLDQQRAVVHPDATNPDDAVSLATDLISLTRTDTITDGDGDTATDDASIDLGPAITFKDDGPALEFEDLVGTITTNTQTSFWSESVGADQPPGTPSITANGTFEMVTPDGTTSTGTVTFDPNTGTGTLTADFDNDASNGDETIDFSLVVNQDGTYDFTLDEVIVPVVTLSTDEGQLPAGGPDPVQTLSFVDNDFVFFAVDADTANSGGSFEPVDIVSAIESGESDLTEAQLEASAAPPIGDNTFPFIREEIEMNVSTTGIGVGNNVFQGFDPTGGTSGDIDPFDPAELPNFDESFVINPEPLASSVKVFISKTAGGFAPPGSGATAAQTDYLYWNLYDELGNNNGPNLVEFSDVFDEAGPGGTGENLWSFTIDIDDVTIAGDFIDAVQFTMGFGDIKIPKIEVEVRGNTPPNDILLDFQATITDADDDPASSDFEIDLSGFESTTAPSEFDYLLEGGTIGSSPEAFNALDQADPLNEYLIKNFDTSEDTLVLNNLAGGAGSFNLDTTQNVIGTSAPDSIITSNAGLLNVIVEDATLQLSNIVG